MLFTNGSSLRSSPGPHLQASVAGVMVKGSREVACCQVLSGMFAGQGESENLDTRCTGVGFRQVGFARL